jgi:hypothetical protein
MQQRLSTDNLLIRFVQIGSAVRRKPFGGITDEIEGIPWSYCHNITSDPFVFTSCAGVAPEPNSQANKPAKQQDNPAQKRQQEIATSTGTVASIEQYGFIRGMYKIGKVCRGEYKLFARKDCPVYLILR